MIINLTKNRIIAEKPLIALSFIERGRGMIGRKFNGFDAMVFNRCNTVHTMMMAMNIDVLFLDSENVICTMHRKLTPWKLFVRSGNAVAVIELPEGTAERTGTEIGDVLNLNAEINRDKEEELKQHLLPTPEAVISMNKQVNK